jgi:hypothetical protein
MAWGIYNYYRDKACCPKCHSRDTYLLCTPDQTTCSILQCLCGFICPVDLHMEYNYYRARVPRREGLKFLNESEVPDWVMQNYSTEYGPSSWRGGVARFNIHKVLEIIPEPLSFYECNSKLSRRDVISILKSDGATVPLGTHSDAQTYEISEAYPQLVDLKAHPDDQRVLASFTQFQYHDVPGFERWYDPELVRYELKLRDELKKISSQPEPAPTKLTHSMIATIDTALDVLEQARQKVDSTDQSTILDSTTCYKVPKENTRFKTFNVALPVRPEHSFDLSGCFKELVKLNKSLCEDGGFVHLMCQNTRTNEIFCVRFRYHACAKRN